MSAKYRWIMLGLSWLLYFSFGIIYRSLAPLVTPIMRELNINYSQMGVIIGAWPLSYLVSSIFAGNIVDKWGIRRSLFLGSLIIAISGILRFFPKSFLGMMFAVVIFGFGGSFISIGCPKTISLWFSGKERGTAVGIYISGLRLGEFVAFSLTNSVIMPIFGYSWRLTLLSFGLTGLLISAVWVIFARDGGINKEPFSGFFKVLAKLLKIRNVALILVLGPIYFGFMHGFTNWLPGILEKSGLSQTAASLAASVPMITGIVSVILIPPLTPLQHRKTVTSLLSFISGVTMLLTVFFADRYLFLTLGLYGLASSSLLPLLTLMLMDTPEVDPQYMGSISGIFFCVGQIGGFLGPALMGFFADLTGSFNSGIILLVFMSFSICVLIFLVKDKKPVKIPR